MKYILITLLSFTFATQITTREFIVSFDSNSSSTISPSEISGLSNGKLEVGGFTGNGQNVGFNLYNDLVCCYELQCYLDNDMPACEAEIGVSFLFNENSEFEISLYNSSNLELKLWITGAFEDEDTSIGDMNNDGSLNIYDILELVNIILEGDSGDIFDVMEIIKRV